jgi:hypothetical protein
VTNRPDPEGGSGLDLIRWQRAKAGTVEHAHQVLTNELAAEALPSQKFGANAAWFRLNVTLYNLLSAFKRVALAAHRPPQAAALRAPERHRQGGRPRPRDRAAAGRGRRAGSSPIAPGSRWPLGRPSSLPSDHAGCVRTRGLTDGGVAAAIRPRSPPSSIPESPAHREARALEPNRISTSKPPATRLHPARERSIPLPGDLGCLLEILPAEQARLERVWFRRWSPRACGGARTRQCGSIASPALWMPNAGVAQE